MKKIVKVLFSLALVVGLAACGNSSDDSAKKMAVVIPDADHGFTGAIVEYAQEYAKELTDDSKAEVEVYTSSDAISQSDQVDTIINNGVDVLVIFPHDGTQLTGSVEKATESNIDVVVFDRNVETDKYVSYVHGDNIGIGEEAAKYLNEMFVDEDSVKMVNLQGIAGISVTEERDQGLFDNLDDKFEVVAEQPADFQQDKAYTVMTDILKANSEIDVVFTHDDDMALGALQAIEEAGRDDIKLLTGVAGSTEAYETIMSDDNPFKVTFYFNPLMIKDAMDVGIDIIEGKDVEKEIVIPSFPIDKDNVEEYYNEDAPF